jgi:hypothetical protein
MPACRRFVGMRHNESPIRVLTACIIKNTLKPFNFKRQTPTFAVLSQTMGVVIRGDLHTGIWIPDSLDQDFFY